MKHKQYNTEPTEEPMIASELAFAYGNASYSDMVATLYRNDCVLEQDNAAVLKRKAEFDEDEDLDDESYNATTLDNPEWEEVIKLGVMVGIEQIKRGQVHDFKDVCNEIKAEYGWN